MPDPEPAAALPLKPVDLGGEVEVEIPRGWTCHWVGSGRWWCGEDAEEGVGVYLKQELADPMPSEPAAPATPLGNARHQAGRHRELLKSWGYGALPGAESTVSGHLLHADRELTWPEGDRSRQLRWMKIDGYSASAALFHLILNIPIERLDDPETPALIAHFARQAAIGNRLPPRAEGALGLRELRVTGGLAVAVPAEWRCEGDGESLCCRLDESGLTLLVMPRHWERAELLARLDPQPPENLPDDAMAREVAEHFAASMPEGTESGAVEPAAHGAIVTAREPGQGGSGPESVDRLIWAYVLVGAARVTGVWFTLFLPPGADAALPPERLDEIAACVHSLRPTGPAEDGD
ncbi:MAG: hypothetical protein U1E53_17070 [Dongiaceae bacterium]